MSRVPKRKSEDQASTPVKSARFDSVRSDAYQWIDVLMNMCKCFGLKCFELVNCIAGSQVAALAISFGFELNETRISSSSKAAKKVDERIDELYTKYANHSSHVIEPEGIEALCSDLKVECTDFRILVLAWKMNAQKQGYFSQDEWRTCLKTLKVDTIAKLKKKLPELVKEALKSENFNSLYIYAFRYCLTEENKKCLDVETACVLLQLVLGFQYPAQVDSFINFLKIQSDYKGINSDQWINFFRFCQEINFPDLENYSNKEAWPLILDNFVDWMKKEENR